MGTWIVLGVLVALGLYVVYLYNTLVRQRQMVREGWSGIDVQLSPVQPNTFKGTLLLPANFETNQAAYLEQLNRCQPRITLGDMSAHSTP